MINFSMDEIKILLGHQELEKYDLHLKLEKAQKAVVDMSLKVGQLEKENFAQSDLIASLEAKVSNLKKELDTVHG